jgi:hypothetical protein
MKFNKIREDEKPSLWEGITEWLALSLHYEFSIRQDVMEIRMSCWNQKRVLPGFLERLFCRPHVGLNEELRITITSGGVRRNVQLGNDPIIFVFCFLTWVEGTCDHFLILYTSIHFLILLNV